MLRDALRELSSRVEGHRHQLDWIMRRLESVEKRLLVGPAAEEVKAPPEAEEPEPAKVLPSDV
jgi:hypothetical protein